MLSPCIVDRTNHEVTIAVALHWTHALQQGLAVSIVNYSGHTLAARSLLVDVNLRQATGGRALAGALRAGSLGTIGLSLLAFLTRQASLHSRWLYGM